MQDALFRFYHHLIYLKKIKSFFKYCDYKQNCIVAIDAD
ncbi:hypothetical protein AO382_0581 [Moraxella catarrhalis]|uniref:Uncharacterized protein n=1 Tax=Moraxella catarrhalis TaxID=480 RepID=A0A7Z0V165_MORCA|nr:hypothetical protein AO382_0581 [Moraxella catarrhalis]